MAAVRKVDELPDGIVLPHRFQEFTGADLLSRFVASDDGKPFSAIPEDSSVICTWRCPGGHEYRASRTSHRSSRGCPVCAGSVATRMPGLLRYWDDKKNALSPLDVSAYDRERYFWRCENGHSFARAPYRVLATGHRCQECRREGKTAWRIHGKRDPGANLLDTHPQIAREWDYERNARGPEEFAPGSQRVAFWVCENGHSWSSAICHRTSTARNQACCQACKAIAYSCPELAAQLHPTLNPPDTANTVRKGSSEPLYWLCELGHTFSASVVARLRANYPASCNKCRAIAVKAPQLIQACWASELNGDLDPTVLGTSSGEKAYWVKLEHVGVPRKKRRAEHYEHKKIGYRYRCYIKNRVREDKAIKLGLSAHKPKVQRKAR
ncbi:zinc-ribbon domain-containing protein [Congregibacter variabilis]|uniref:Zinc-ribbon domain-containing protein n=1 Tax=Congregibacter variabilis TaxID=3081200 RepID=A0ABZ0I603_9GAMM|nr:zinc-ribbon domain-containing protein [Congregibacter sp. IMCC43200]